jgi:hypothetical protein
VTRIVTGTAESLAPCHRDGANHGDRDRDSAATSSLSQQIEVLLFSIILFFYTHYLLLFCIIFLFILIIFLAVSRLLFPFIFLKRMYYYTHYFISIIFIIFLMFIISFILIISIILSLFRLSLCSIICRLWPSGQGGHTLLP